MAGNTERHFLRFRQAEASGKNLIGPIPERRRQILGDELPGGLKAFFIDLSRCTACRGCQIACKEWNELPANATKQRGSHQNPPVLNPNNFKVVRFNEHLEKGLYARNTPKRSWPTLTRSV
jgi:hypothetical protein